jgi:hypothetical protein
VLLARSLLLEDGAQACNRTRRAAKGHGEAFKTEREKRLGRPLFDDRPRAASRSAKERRIID